MLKFLSFCTVSSNNFDHAVVLDDAVVDACW